MAHFHTLPDELLLCIFDSIIEPNNRHHDRIINTCSKVCQRWRKIATPLLLAIAVDSNNDGPVWSAMIVKSQHTDVIKCAIDESCCDVFGIQHLITAISTSNLFLIDALLTSPNLLSEYRAVESDWAGLSPLMVAASRGSLEVVKRLLDVEDINHKLYSQLGLNALGAACFFGRTDVARLLLSLGFDTDNHFPLPRTLIELAANAANHHLIELLLQYIPLEAQSPTAISAALIYVASYGRWYTSYDQKLGPEVDNLFDKEILPHLSSTNAQCCIDLLLKIGADINAEMADGVTALLTAIRYNRMDAARMLLDRGAIFTPARYDGFSALYWAVIYNDMEMAKVVVRNAIKNGYLFDKNSYCELLIKAAKDGILEMVEHALTHGADADSWTGPLRERIRRRISSKRLTETPLFNAAVMGHFEICKLLLDYGASPDTESAINQSLPHLMGDIEITKLFLDRGLPIETEDSSFRGLTLFLISCSRGDVERMAFLLDRGASIDACSRWCPGGVPYHITPSHGAMYWAAYSGSVEAVNLLASRGASVNTRSYTENTPLHCASRHGWVPVARRLLELGADPQVRNIDGLKPLFVAASIDMAELLAKWEVDIHTKRVDGLPIAHSVFSFPKQRGQVAGRIIKGILDAGFELDTRDDTGNTILHAALVSRRNTASVRAILDFPVDVNAINNDGCTPLMIACSSGSVENIWMLLQMGGRISGIEEPKPTVGCDATAPYGSCIGPKTTVRLARDRKGYETIKLILKTAGYTSHMIFFDSKKSRKVVERWLTSKLQIIYPPPTRSPQLLGNMAIQTIEY